MKKIMIIIGLMASCNAFSGQAIYKCVVKGKVTYSNNEKDKDCQTTDITETSKMTILNKKFTNEKTNEQIIGNDKLNIKSSTSKNMQESINKNNLLNNKLGEQRRQVEELLKNIEQNHIENLESAIKSSGG